MAFMAFICHLAVSLLFHADLVSWATYRKFNLTSHPHFRGAFRLLEKGADVEGWMRLARFDIKFTWRPFRSYFHIKNFQETPEPTFRIKNIEWMFHWGEGPKRFLTLHVKVPRGLREKMFSAISGGMEKFLDLEILRKLEYIQCFLNGFLTLGVPQKSSNYIPKILMNFWRNFEFPGFPGLGNEISYTISWIKNPREV